jgi:hypothetical protein
MRNVYLEKGVLFIGAFVVDFHAYNSARHVIAATCLQA